MGKERPCGPARRGMVGSRQDHGGSSPLPAVERTYRTAPNSAFLYHTGLIDHPYGPAYDAPLASWVPGQGLTRVAADGRIQAWREWVEGGGSLGQFAAPFAGKAVGGVSKAVLNAAQVSRIIERGGVPRGAAPVSTRPLPQTLTATRPPMQFNPVRHPVQFNEPLTAHPRGSSLGKWA